MTAKGLVCRNCGKVYPLAPSSICLECFGPLEVLYDYEKAREVITKRAIERGPTTLWRYRDLLPVSREPVDLGAGFTPLVRADNLARELGLRELYIKNDSVNPTFSFKDRVVSVAVTAALELGFYALGCASTGNLAASVAAHGARAGLPCYIFIPSNLSQGKVLQTLAYGPTLVAVDGNYDQVNRLCTEIAGYHNWAFVNINLRPFYAEGSKTLGFEVAEQLGWRTPDRVVIPAGSGSLLTKIWKGFREFRELGLAEGDIPRLTAAQSAGCGPIAGAWRSGSPIQPVKPDTIEQSLAIGNPADGEYALRGIRETGGTAGLATDTEIIQGIKLLARTEGIFTETAGGVVVATLKNLVEAGEIDPDESTVAYITGCGLKTQEVLREGLPTPVAIRPDLGAFQEAFNLLGKTQEIGGVA